MQRVNPSAILRDFQRSFLVVFFPIVFLIGKTFLFPQPVTENNDNRSSISSFTSNEVDSLVPKNTQPANWVARTKIIENELSLAKNNVDLLNKINKVKKCSLYTGWNQQISIYFSTCVKSTTSSLSDWDLKQTDIDVLTKLLIDFHPSLFYQDSKDLKIAIDNARRFCRSNYQRELLQILLEDITAPRYEPLKCQPSNPPS